MTQISKKSSINKPFNAIVYGGDGDLAFRKIYPALFHRFVDDQLQCDFRIFPVTRSDRKHVNFFDDLKQFIRLSSAYEVDGSKLDHFFEKFQLFIIPEHTDENYTEIKKAIDEFPTYQSIYYLSTPSSAFGPICECLKRSGLVNSKSKVVLEKPLGNSLISSKEIHQKISKSFSENQIYRIDHYLGKETVQNLMVLRFANHLFEYSWNSDHIESVFITVAESLGVEKRGEYYDKSGALLDMVQNHLLQLLCLVAMEPPASLEADAVRNEKLKVIKALRLLDKKLVKTETVRGQYSRGMVNGEQLNSYLEDIEKYSSNTETYVAIKAHIDNWRWKNTPFYMQTGKRMASRCSEIVINFRSVRHNLFPQQGEIPGNQLIIRLQPEERIELVQMTKLPGPGGYRYKPISLKLDYVDSFSERFPDAYERLIMDVLRGNQTLFMRQDELEAAWIWIESIVKAWNEADMKNVLYEAGSSGPGNLLIKDEPLWCTDK